MAFNPQLLNLMMEFIYIDVDKSYQQELQYFIAENQQMNKQRAMGYGFSFNDENYYFSSQYEHLGVMPLTVQLAPSFRKFLLKWGNISEEKRKISAFLRRALVLAKSMNEVYYLLPPDLAKHINRYGTLGLDTLTKDGMPRLNRFKENNKVYYEEIQERMLKNLILKDTKDKSIT